MPFSGLKIQSQKATATRRRQDAMPIQARRLIFRKNTPKSAELRTSKLARNYDHGRLRSIRLLDIFQDFFGIFSRLDSRTKAYGEIGGETRNRGRKNDKWALIKDFLKYSLLTNERGEVKIPDEECFSPRAKAFGQEQFAGNCG